MFASGRLFLDRIDDQYMAGIKTATMIAENVMRHQVDFSAVHIERCTDHFGVETFFLRNEAVGEDHSHQFDKYDRLLLLGYFMIDLVAKMLDIIFRVTGQILG